MYIESEFMLLEAENERLTRENEKLTEALHSLLDGLDSNYDERCGLTNDQWEERIKAARHVLLPEVECTCLPDLPGRGPVCEADSKDEIPSIFQFGGE